LFGRLIERSETSSDTQIWEKERGKYVSWILSRRGW